MGGWAGDTGARPWATLRIWGAENVPRLQRKPVVGTVRTWSRCWFVCEMGVVHKVSFLGATNIR